MLGKRRPTFGRWLAAGTDDLHLKDHVAAGTDWECSVGEPTATHWPEHAPHVSGATWASADPWRVDAPGCAWGAALSV